VLKVEIWSDVVCPWCYIGKRRFEQALEKFPHRADVEVVWRSFELDPQAPAERTGDPSERLAQKYGVTSERARAMHQHMTDVAAEEGLEFDFARARSGNTFDAHRLIHLAAEQGVQGAVKERLLRAYFSDGEPIGDRDTLVRLAVEAGIDEATAREVLASDRFTEEVRADEADAQRFGITGVPFFVLDRAFGVSGAQTPDVLLDALHQAWDHANPAPALTSLGASDAAACADDTCAL
jgi:predicted DsbA family dithiol-disulfide isomerase